MAEETVPSDYFLESFELSNLQAILMSLRRLSCLDGGDNFQYSGTRQHRKVVLRWESERALRMKDDMMAPLRCKSKAEELGLTDETDWKDYFARDEPFHEID